MIKDCLKNANLYYGLSEGIKIGLEWLKNADLKTIKDGRYEIEGSLVYANVQTYETKDQAKYESHKRYIDVQYVVEGKEKIGVCDKSKCKTCVEYDEIKDIEFYDNTGDDEWQIIYKGEFIILYPHEAHKPSIKYTQNSIVKKVVVKVAVDN